MCECDIKPKKNEGYFWNSPYKVSGFKVIQKRMRSGPVAMSLSQRFVIAISGLPFPPIASSPIQYTHHSLLLNEKRKEKSILETIMKRGKENQKSQPSYQILVFQIEHIKWGSNSPSIQTL